MKDYQNAMKRRLIDSLWIAVTLFASTFAFSPSQSSTRRAPTRLFASSDDGDDAYYLDSLLQQYGWEKRSITITNFYLPLLAEVQLGGQARIGQITDLLLEDGKSPKFQLTTSHGDTAKVDLGQLTTIWTESQDASLQEVSIPTSLDPLPVAHIDEKLDRLYQSPAVERGRTNGLTKKQVNKIIEEAPSSCQSTIDSILRQLGKAGPGFCRLIDSESVRESLWEKSDTGESSPLQRRAMAANILNDSGGGRFKRMPSLLLSHDSESITLINGGWMVVDQAVRAASEARELAERGTSKGTNADERILQRLECLAMGQDKDDLEVDVREFLKARNLRLTPQGARDALVQMGLWSDKSNQQKPQPWSPPILQAAEWYRAMNKKRQLRMQEYTQNGKTVENRVDLTKLPCVCVDAARASFRDDAVGVRSRSSTGRKSHPNSKWEILLHIADVSDLYAPDIASRSEHLLVLGEAAANRGTSRYDLPGGPLHLLPPIVLESLALETINPDLSSNAPIPMNRPNVSRCVTLWVYIDETNGKILDAGIERTLISCPLALSFQVASALLDGSLEKEDPALTKVKAILAVVERDLGLWSEHRRQSSSTAQAREERLAARETVGKQVFGNSRGRDDGREGFQRTRGHRLVDSCLDLYGYSMNGLLRRANASLPRVAGTERDGRVATAPLRRYIDGVAQRQAIAELCGYGGPPLTTAECAEVGKRATQAINAISNIRSSKKQGGKVSSQQQKAARALRFQMADNNNPLPAMSTGKQSEVVVIGVGAIATCKGIKGTLKPGEKIMVKIRNIDEATGKVSAVLVD
jgi:hypothetical protein